MLFSSLFLGVQSASVQIQSGSGMITPCDPKEGYNFNPKCKIGEYCVLRKVSGGQRAWLCMLNFS